MVHSTRLELELELGLIQTHMAQKPVLRVEVCARALRVRSVLREEAWAAFCCSSTACSPHPARSAAWPRGPCLALELELIHAHMAQKPMLRVEVGARALRMRSVPREEAWASAGVQDAWVSGCGCEAD